MPTFSAAPLGLGLFDASVPRPLAWATIGLPRRGGRTTTRQSERSPHGSRKIPKGGRRESQRDGPISAQANGLGKHRVKHREPQRGGPIEHGETSTIDEIAFLQHEQRPSLSRSLRLYPIRNFA